MHILLAWPIRPWEFRRKSGFEASRAIFWFKKRKFTAKPNEGNVLRSPNLVSRGRNDSCDPFVQFISSWILHMRRKQNFEIVFGFKSDTAVLTFSLRFLSTPLPLLFLSVFCAFLAFVSDGKDFGITFMSRNYMSKKFCPLAFMKFSTYNKYF